MPPKILVISGPTASGKTRLAVELALRHGGEVVSADSMQVYRRMDIGTAKPTPEEMRGIPHHMLDAVSYTHLDVYKRQAWASVAPVSMARVGSFTGLTPVRAPQGGSPPSRAVPAW